VAAPHVSSHLRAQRGGHRDGIGSPSYGGGDCSQLPDRRGAAQLGGVRDRSRAFVLTYTPRRRYLVSFDMKCVPHMFADVLIIGAGIAGVRAALEIDPRLRVVVVTKDRIEISSSSWAQGGIAGVLDPEDSIADHADDTIVAGAGLCDTEVVAAVVEAAPELIRELVEYGARLDRIGDELALTRARKSVVE